MRILLDTHVFLWACLEPDRISESARGLLEDPANDLLLSAASSWEIATKVALKKLELPAPPARYVPSRLDAMGLTPLPVEHGPPCGSHSYRVITAIPSTGSSSPSRSSRTRLLPPGIPSSCSTMSTFCGRRPASPRRRCTVDPRDAGGGGSRRERGRAG
jgi:PIN domain nuclease of toxin-antitoxin system